MKVNEDGDVVFEPLEWVDSMTPAARLHLLHHLAGSDQIIEAAIQSVMGEWFFDGDMPDECVGGWWNSMSRELQAKLIPLMPEIAKRLIAQLLVELKDVEKDRRRHSSWAWAMYHAWPQDAWRSRPLLPEFETGTHWRDEQLEAERLLATQAKTQ